MILDKYRAIAPVFLEIDISFVFNIIVIFCFNCPILFNASSAIPLVKAPSPMIATIFPFSPLFSLATAMPSAADKEVEECPAPKISNWDSERFK